MCSTFCLRSPQHRDVSSKAFYKDLGSDGEQDADSDSLGADSDEDGGEELILEEGDYVDAQGMSEEEERLVGAFMNTAGEQHSCHVMFTQESIDV